MRQQYYRILFSKKLISYLMIIRTYFNASYRLTIPLSFMFPQITDLRHCSIDRGRVITIHITRSLINFNYVIMLDRRAKFPNYFSLLNHVIIERWTQNFNMFRRELVTDYWRPDRESSKNTTIWLYYGNLFYARREKLVLIFRTNLRTVRDQRAAVKFGVPFGKIILKTSYRIPRARMALTLPWTLLYVPVHRIDNRVTKIKL